jgi:transcriptional regulator with XRE-family HTH domain
MVNDTAPPRRPQSPTEYLDGGKLWQRRRAAGLTQKRLGEIIGRTQDRIAHWEAGDDDAGCGIEMIADLADAVGCQMPDLMHEDGVKAFDRLAKAIQSAPGAVTATAT